MANGIINAVTGGLGLITELANEFLTGFTTLLVDAQGQLTAFGTWAFIMLGVSISFAVIKLVMNLVRNNTGI